MSKRASVSPENGPAARKAPWEVPGRPERTGETPAWLRRGVRCGSSHEPLAFLRRRGGFTTDLEATHAWNYSEETVRGLAERGIEMIVVHGYKGMGLEFEKRELEQYTRRTAEACRKYGVRLGTYCQVASIFPETFFKDYPQGREWVVRDYRGEPHYYGNQTFRVYPCLRTPGFREYYKTVVRYLVEDIGADFLHFDNLLESLEPHSCHCPNCRAAFTDFLRRRYGGDEFARKRVERFGFDDLDVIEPPVFSDWQHPGAIEIVENPVMQEWMWFRCETTADFIAAISAFVRGLDPDVGVEANVGYFPAPNRIRGCATFAAWLAPSLDIIFNEDPQRLPRITDDGVVATNIRAFKIARGQRIGCFGGGAYAGQEGLERTAAERLAFAPDFSWWMGSPASLAHDDLPHLKYLDFYRKNAELYHDVDVIADVTLLRSFPSLANSIHEVNLLACVAEQGLIEARIPWVTVSDEALDDLSGVRVLFLPGVECVSEWMASSVLAFVRDGGALVATGDTSRFDEWRRKRPAALLAEMLGEADWPKRSRRWKLGKGRVAYLPEIELRTPVHLPPLGIPALMPVDPRYWKLARNHAQIVRALRWAAGGEFSVEVDAPKGVCCEFTRQEEAGRTLIHFVNLRDRPARNVAVRLPKALRRAARRVEFLGPDLRKPRSAKVADDDPAFRAPPVERYLVAVITP